jgi:hypothetical protein
MPSIFVLIADSLWKKESKPGHTNTSGQWQLPSNLQVAKIPWTKSKLGNAGLNSSIFNRYDLDYILATFVLQVVLNFLI